MLKIFETNKKELCFIGDIHGSFGALRGVMNRTQLNDVLYVICGDCGFGFENRQYYTDTFNRLSKTCEKYNADFLFIRGNHDDPYYFNGERIKHKYFNTVPDYTVIKTPTHNVLCVGGGISVDRVYRKSRHNDNVLKYAFFHNCPLETAEQECPKIYWEDEQCFFDEGALEQLKAEGINIDIVCTHTCPSFTQPISKDGILAWLANDIELDKDLTEERGVMDKIYHKLKEDGHSLTNWYYAHFHYHNSEVYEDTKFTLLDMERNGNTDVEMLPF